MRNRIQKSMIFVVTMSLLISYILVTLVIYRQALDIRRSELVQEAEYNRAAIEISGEEYFGTMDKVSKRTREHGSIKTEKYFMIPEMIRKRWQTTNQEKNSKRHWQMAVGRISVCQTAKDRRCTIMR